MHDETTQVPLLQVAEPFCAKQTMPQPPQLLGSFVVVVSQPFPELPSQSALPAAHDVTVQTLLVHAGVPPWGGQTLPQALQLLTLLVVLISHPFAALPSQLAKPALHTIEHCPPPQDGAPLLLLHAAPHAPQFDTFVASCTSQPSAGLPLQSAYPALHAATTQDPFEHPGVALGVEQTVPQPPQFAGLLLRFTSQPSAELPLQLALGTVHAPS